MKQFLNASEVAKILNIDRATVHRWIRQGRVKGVYKTAGQLKWKIPISTAEELKRKQYESSNV